MRYLFIVSVLARADDSRRTTSLEKRLNTGTEAKQCTAVDGGNKTYFSHLKKGPPKKINISLSVHYI